MRSHEERSVKPKILVVVLFIAIPVLLAFTSLVINVSAREADGKLASIESPPLIGTPTPPPNDDITSATVISSLPYTNTQSTDGATLEAGEPTYSCGYQVGATVWYQYIPSTTGVFVVDTFGSDFDTVLHIYQDVGSFPEINCNAYSGGLQSQVVVSGTAGMPYLISIGGNGGASGSMTINVFDPGPFTSCAAVDVPEAECLVLLDFYTATGGPSWYDDSGWLATSQVCTTWYGIYCSAGHVEEIILYGNNLVGSLSTDFTNLPNLWSLSLSGNQLTGDLSTIIGNLPTGLGYLNLYINNLTGTVPSSISSFTNLYGLDVGANDLYGDLSTIIGYLPTSLEYLFMDSNNFTGTVPSSISDLTNLFTLYFADNIGLAGVIPTSITALSLNTFNFSNTYLCEPDDAGYDTWKAGVPYYYPGLCGTAINTIGLYNSTYAAYYLKTVNEGGTPDIVFQYGATDPTWIPLMGDWDGDGFDSVGVYVPSLSIFFLKDTNEGGASDYSIQYGPPGAGWIPLVGDWDGDGDDTLGLFDPTYSAFYLANELAGGTIPPVFYGAPGLGWTPLVGDWDGDGDDTLGLFDPTYSVFYLSNELVGGSTPPIFYGASGWTPIVGDWDSDGDDTIGVYVPDSSVFFLKNSNETGTSDLGFQYGPPGAGWIPLTGRFESGSGSPSFTENMPRLDFGIDIPQAPNQKQ